MILRCDTPESVSSLAVALLETTIAVMKDDAKARNERIFPITPIALRLAWDRLTKRAKIDDLNFHDLRHEAISRLFELGLTVPEVASISGHRDLRMLFRYAHATHASIRAKLAAVPGAEAGNPRAKRLNDAAPTVSGENVLVM